MERTLAFFEGSEDHYQKLINKDPFAFYKTENNLYLGERKISNDQDLQLLKEFNTQKFTEISSQIENKLSLPQTILSKGQIPITDGKGGVSWITILNSEEVQY